LVEQARLQAPQFWASMSRLVSQPFAARPSQSAYPDLQLAIAHLPAELHVPVALVSVQEFPQKPQFGTFVRSASQTVPGFPSHSAVPDGQVFVLQAPAVHVSFVAQLLLHEPQCWGSVSVLLSQPSTGSELQSS